MHLEQVRQIESSKLHNQVLGISKQNLKKNGYSAYVGKGPFILLCQMISVKCPTYFEFGATFSIVVYGLYWFWFEYDLVLYIRQQQMALDPIQKATPSVDLISKLRELTMFEVTTDQQAFKICWAFYCKYSAKDLYYVSKESGWVGQSKIYVSKILEESRKK